MLGLVDQCFPFLTGNPCLVSYKTIHERVPYCGVSSWLEWDCSTSGGDPMATLTRLRVMCCSSGHNCFSECNHPSDINKDSTLAGNVCPPFFQSSPASSTQTTPLPSTVTAGITASGTHKTTGSPNAHSANKSCHIMYRNLNEVVPYCGLSSWLEWDCSVIRDPMTSVTRLRGICCESGICKDECGLHADIDKETMLTGFVCPPYFPCRPSSNVETTTP